MANSSCERCISKSLSCSFQESFNTFPPFDLSSTVLAPAEIPTYGPWQTFYANDIFADTQWTYPPLQDDQTLALPSPSSSWDSLELMLPSSTTNPKLFEPKLLLKIEAVVSSTIAIGILRSIPESMRRRETFPPFIHPCCYGTLDTGWKLPKPLARATMIAQMFGQRNTENRSLLWQTICLEQTSLIEEVNTGN